jgi:hypothetical protein
MEEGILMACFIKKLKINDKKLKDKIDSAKLIFLTNL